MKQKQNRSVIFGACLGLLFVLAVGIVAAEINTLTGGYRSKAGNMLDAVLNPSYTSGITAFSASSGSNICNKISNVGSDDYFVPTASGDEWDAFRAATNSNADLSLFDCCVANQGASCGASTCSEAGTVACDGSCTGVTTLHGGQIIDEVNFDGSNIGGKHVQLSDGTIVAIEDNDLIKIDSNLNVVSRVTVSSPNLSEMTTDGSYIYVRGYDTSAGKEVINKFNSSLSKESWSADSPCSGNSLAVDSSYIYVTCNAYGEGLRGVYMVDKSTGASVKYFTEQIEYGTYSFGPSNIAVGNNHIHLIYTYNSDDEIKVIRSYNRSSLASASKIPLTNMIIATPTANISLAGKLPGGRAIDIHAKDGTVYVLGHKKDATNTHYVALAYSDAATPSFQEEKNLETHPTSPYCSAEYLCNPESISAYSGHLYVTDYYNVTKYYSCD